MKKLLKLPLLLGATLLGGVAPAATLPEASVHDSMTMQMEYLVYGTWQGDLNIVSPSGNVNTASHSSCSSGLAIGYGLFTYVPNTTFSTQIYGNSVSNIHIFLSPQFAGSLDERGPDANVTNFRLLVDGEEKSE